MYLRVMACSTGREGPTKSALEGNSHLKNTLPIVGSPKSEMIWSVPSYLGLFPEGTVAAFMPTGLVPLLPKRANVTSEMPVIPGAPGLKRVVGKGFSTLIFVNLK